MRTFALILFCFNCLFCWLPVTRAEGIATADSPSQPSAQALSPAAQQLAEQLGVWQALQNLVLARQTNPTWRTDSTVLAIRQNLIEDIFTAELEVRTAQSRLDGEIALMDEVRAKLEERRDKAVTLTAAAGVITNAFNGITGNALDFSEKLSLPARILEVADGGVGFSLAALALKQQQGEKKISERVGGMISRIFDNTTKNVDYPDSVWLFLNTAPPGQGGGLTRRATLINNWAKEGIIRQGRSKWEHRLSHITNGTVDRHRITISVLEDRDAMLHDLRAAISPMDVLLLEMMTLVRMRQ